MPPSHTLKSKTKAAHVRAEQSVDLKAVCHRLPAYAGHLANLWRWHQSVVTTVRHLLQTEPPSPALAHWLTHHQARLALLAKDIKSGPQSHHAAIAPSHHADDTPQPALFSAWTQSPTAQPVAAAWGLLYVAMGSMLGGQHIARMLSDHITEQAGTDFLSGGELGAWHKHWPTFLCDLNQQLAADADLAQAIAAAQAGFEAFEQAQRPVPC